MRRLWLVLALALGCEGSRINKQALAEGCQRNVDCLYGLECVEAPAGQKVGKTCQFKSFGDCDQDDLLPLRAGVGLVPAWRRFLREQARQFGHQRVGPPRSPLVEGARAQDHAGDEEGGAWQRG